MADDDDDDDDARPLKPRFTISAVDPKQKKADS